VTNLVGNAIKFTDAGEVRVRATVANSRFAVSVADTGPGIPEEHQARIFDQFHQVDVIPSAWTGTVPSLRARSGFYLAPAGTDNFGLNQCKNDKDGTVDHDERLRITGVETGIYDAKFTNIKGRTCVIKDLKVEAGQIFSIEESELTASACATRSEVETEALS